MVTGMSFAVLMLNGSYKKERNEVPSESWNGFFLYVLSLAPLPTVDIRYGEEIVRYKER